MAAELKTIEPMSVLGLEHIGPYNQIGPKFDQLMGLVFKNGWPCTGCLGIYFDDPMQVPEEKLRSMACAIVPSGFDPGSSEVKPYAISGGEYAVKKHIGSFAKLGESWMEFYSKDLPALGVDDAGPPFEVYVSDPRSTPEAELLTELYIPVKPR